MRCMARCRIKPLTTTSGIKHSTDPTERDRMAAAIAREPSATATGRVHRTRHPDTVAMGMAALRVPRAGRPARVRQHLIHGGSTPCHRLHRAMWEHRLRLFFRRRRRHMRFLNPFVFDALESAIGDSHDCVCLHPHNGGCPCGSVRSGSRLRWPELPPQSHHPLRQFPTTIWSGLFRSAILAIQP